MYHYYALLEDMIKSIAWPIVTLIIIYLLLPTFQILVKSLKTLKVKEVEFDFDKEVKSIKQEVQHETSRQDSKEKFQVTRTDSLLTNMHELVKMNSKAIVYQAWDYLEMSILQKANKNKENKIDNVTEALYELDDEHINLYYRIYALKEKWLLSEKELEKEVAIEIADTIMSIALGLGKDK